MDGPFTGECARRIGTTLSLPRRGRVARSAGRGGLDDTRIEFGLPSRPTRLRFAQTPSPSGEGEYASYPSGWSASTVAPDCRARSAWIRRIVAWAAGSFITPPSMTRACAASDWTPKASDRASHGDKALG